MAKIKLNNNKKGKGLIKTFAFGGFEFDDPQSVISESQRQVAQADLDTMNDSSLNTWKTIGGVSSALGNMMMSYGATQDGGENRGGFMGKLANSGFGKFINNNAQGILNGSNQISGAILKDYSFASGGMIIPEYGEGGTIKINPKNTGKFTKSAEVAGMGVQEFAAHVLANPGNYTPLMRKRANFAHNASKWQHAMGGETPQVPVEVEGNELGQMPNGQMLNFQGPSHENGGIPISLPAGTKIYSDRVSIDGKTMAQRKAARERKLKVLDKKATSGDQIAKDTLDRYMLTSGKEEQLDMSIQQMLNQADNTPQFKKGGEVPMYEEGGITAFTPGTSNYDRDLLNQELNKGLTPFTYSPSVNDLNNLSGTTSSLNIGIPTQNTTSTVGTEKPGFWDTIQSIFDKGPTGGDLLGMYGNLKSAYAGKKNTLANRAGDNPNQNFYKQYGKEGLKTLDESKTYINQIGDIKRSEIELARNTATAKNRQTARGINTMRALDLASQAGATRADMQTYAEESAQMMNILGQEAQMKNNIDQVVMGGEQARDIADRQDRDNFYTQLIRDEQSIGEGLATTGKSINDIKERNAKLNAMNDAYGNFKYTSSGKLKGIPGNVPARNLVEDVKANPKNYGLTDAQVKAMTEQDLVKAAYNKAFGLDKDKEDK